MAFNLKIKCCFKKYWDVDDTKKKTTNIKRSYMFKLNDKSRYYCNALFVHEVRQSSWFKLKQI